MEPLVEAIASALLRRNETLATAESCTGGLVGAALTALPGSSAWYLGGFVSYSNDLKIRLLGVPPDLLAARGAVSPETVRAMAEGARAAARADHAVAVSGIAGPGGGSPDKPVGLVFFAVAGPRGAVVAERRFPGSRADVRQAALETALRLVLESLSGP